MGGEQLLDLRNLRGGQPGEDVAEIFLWVQPSPPAADQDLWQAHPPEQSTRMLNTEVHPLTFVA